MRTIKGMGWLAAALAAGIAWGGQGPGACTAAGYDGLNFWVGNWKVSDAAGNELGSSRIEAGLDGCELIETWGSGSNFRGRNVHAYSAEERRWRQLNVDNHGHVHAFEGVAGKGGLEYTGTSKSESGGDILNRMDILNLDAGRVKVWWRKSADAGKTWTTAYEAIYTRMDRTK